MLKRIAYLTLLIALGTWPAGAARTRTNVDRGWKFLLADDAKASEPAFDDAKWQYVDLPHSFSEPYFRSPDFYVGYGWYRRHVHVDAAALKGQTFLEFEGAFQDAEVFVNGKKAGEHLGGYTGFSIGLTGDLHAGDNVIAVRVNNLWNGQLNPRAGEHVFSGGIYRDVYLVTTSNVHVPWFGTFVTTPKVSDQEATLDVKTEVRNGSGSTTTAVLKTAILDPAGRQVAEYSSENKIDAGGLVSVDQGGNLAAPKLWSRRRLRCTSPLAAFTSTACCRTSSAPGSASAGLRGRRTMD